MDRTYWNPRIVSSQLAIVAAIVGITLPFLSGCAGTGAKVTAPPLVEKATTTTGGEPSHITVQHVLIGFEGSMPNGKVTRTRQEAHALANQVLQRAQAGESFDALVKEFTDDSAPGIYHLANHGQPSDMSPAEVADKVFPRSGMVPAFGDVGFPLKVGEIGMSQFDFQASPFGWHIVKRLR